jgi:hypothetical protein
VVYLLLHPPQFLSSSLSLSDKLMGSPGEGGKGLVERTLGVKAGNAKVLQNVRLGEA